MAYVNVVFLGSKMVVRCENCGVNVATIDSAEILPLLYSLGRNGNTVLCFDCEGGGDYVPLMLLPTNDTIVQVGDIAIEQDEEGKFHSWVVG